MTVFSVSFKMNSYMTQVTWDDRNQKTYIKTTELQFEVLLAKYLVAFT